MIASASKRIPFEQILLCSSSVLRCNRVEIGEAIRRLRAEANVSQTALAAALDTSQTQISRWELGRATPNLEQISDIEKALELRRGEVLIAAGYVDPKIGDVEQAIMGDRRIGSQDRKLLIGVYELVRFWQDEQRKRRRRTTAHRSA